MARRTGPSPSRRPAAPEAVPLPAILLALAVLAALLAVAPSAEAAFDAPKRLAAAVGLAAAAALALFRPDRPETLAGAFLSPAGALLVAGSAASLISAGLSPRPAIAWDALRWGAILSLAVLLGASSALKGGRSVLPGVALVAGAAANAAAALIAKAGWSPFRLVPRPLAGGLAAGAFLGNEGLLGIALGLAAPVALAFVLAAPSRRARAASAAMLVLVLVALPSVRSLTGVVAAAAGLSAVALASPRLRRPALAAVPVALALLAAIPATRSRLVALAGDLRSGDLDAVVSYRAGPWAAAGEMARARPLAGFGPGTFGAEYYPHRLAAERRAQRRLTAPVPYTSYASAHNDLLQGAAELGLPAALAFLAAALLVAARLARHAVRDPEAAALLGLLLAGGVASISWFPLHRPELALPLLIALGRGLTAGAERAPA